MHQLLIDVKRSPTAQLMVHLPLHLALLAVASLPQDLQL
jgi:hypothetical protein